MRLSLRWCVTNYSESLHIFISLVNVRRKYQSLDWRLVNQRRQIIDCVFRFFYSSKYLTTLRSNISLCQKATTLILIPLCTPSFRLWKPSKKSSGTIVFLSWMPFKICDCNKFLSTTLVTQFLLEAVTWPNKPTLFSSLYKTIDQENQKMWKLSRFFVGKKNVYV